MLNVFMLSVANKPIMLSVFMLSLVMLFVCMLRLVMLNTFSMYALKSESRVLGLFAIHTISHPLPLSRYHSICVWCVYALLSLSLWRVSAVMCVCVGGCGCAD